MSFDPFDDNKITLHGMTPTDAVKIVREAVPEVKDWMLWAMDPEPAERILRVLAGDGINAKGKWGKWTWERVPCSYPEIHHWGGRTRTPKIGYGWTGLLRIRGPKGEDFYMFSYQRPDLEINKEYLVSTGDLKMLRGFVKDVNRILSRRKKGHKIRINVMNGPDMSLDTRDQEDIYLPDRMHEDIESQVDYFFSNADLYKKMKIPHRRGLLFAGPPGTGKTMMVRNLVRKCHAKYGTVCNYLSVTQNTDDGDIMRFFMMADERRPVMLVLEELDSLLRESRTTRATLLAQLDGLAPTKGVLVVATTNNPDLIDPALVHRPSRFDRVWKFPLPTRELRLNYMRETFELKDGEDIYSRIAGKTAGWTFAYLKELRVTASFIALGEGHQNMTEGSLGKAFRLLDTQFKAGAKNFTGSDTPEAGVGFLTESEIEDELLLVSRKK